jgi:hypothetical protein
MDERMIRFILSKKENRKSEFGWMFYGAGWISLSLSLLSLIKPLEATGILVMASFMFFFVCFYSWWFDKKTFEQRREKLLAELKQY